MLADGSCEVGRVSDAGHRAPFLVGQSGNLRTGRHARAVFELPVGGAAGRGQAKEVDSLQPVDLKTTSFLERDYTRFRHVCQGCPLIQTKGGTF